MLFQRVNETGPERLFVIAKNTWSTASLTADQWAAWDDATDKDGVGVTKPGGVMLGSVAGVVTETIAHGDFGVIQAWGYRATAETRGGSGGTAVAGSKMVSGAFLHFRTASFGAYALHTLASTVTIKPWQLDKCGRFLAHANTVGRSSQNTTGIGSVFINCL